jgi:transposase-like protein
VDQALDVVFPKTTLQTCIGHLIRNSLDYASWKTASHWQRRCVRVVAGGDASGSRGWQFARLGGVEDFIPSRGFSGLMFPPGNASILN